ncbi:trypsin-like serine peptidase [Winslowiella sp. 2C04]|uniref:trypsin-like serine peptidase n=1 Tax=Winslowiella sp. 2C04 TaxID=3416179 RepID=UPI003CEC37D0
MNINLKKTLLAAAISCCLPAAQANMSAIDADVSAGAPLTAANPGYIDEKINVNLAEKLGVDGNATVTITKAGASELLIHFSDVSLQPGAYLRVSSPDGQQTEIINHKALYDGSGTNFDSSIRGNTALVQLVYPDRFNRHANNDRAIVSHFSYPAASDDEIGSKNIIGNNQAVDSRCYEQSKPVLYNTSQASMRFAGATGWNLAGGPYAITNHHVIDHAPNSSFLLQYNYQNNGCNSNSVSHVVSMRTERQLQAGNNNVNNDYALYAVNANDYQEAGIRQIFGNLWLNSASSLPAGTPVYVAHQLWGGVQKINDRHDDGGPCTLIGSTGGHYVRYNCDTSAGSSGAPVIVQADNTIAGLHVGGTSTENVGISAPRLYDLIKATVPGPNTTYPLTVGQGKVSVTNLTVNPYIPAQPAHLTSWGDVKVSSHYEGRMQHFGSYSIFVAKLRATGGAVEQINVRMQVRTPCGLTDLNAAQPCSTAAGDRFLELSVLAEDNATLTSPAYSGFMALRVTNLQNELIRNLVVPFSYAHYDPFVSPFTPGTSVRSFNMTTQHLETPRMSHSNNFGFIAVNQGQGPLATTSVAGGGSTRVQVPLKNARGEVKLVNLDVLRKTSCAGAPGSGPMESIVGCGSTAQTANLDLRFWYGSNPGLPSGRYTGILPLKQKRDGFEQAIMINIDFTI